MDELPLIGLENEYSAVRLALRNRTSVLLLGSAGSGKTKLIQTLLSRTGEPALYLGRTPVLHELLVELARATCAAGRPPLPVPRGSDGVRWIARQTSVRLKGMLWDAFATLPVPVVLDHIQDASSRSYRFLQRLYHTPGMSIIAVARRPYDLGELHRLFWDPRQTVHIKPLAERNALRLFDEAVHWFGSECANLADFRESVLRNAHGNPGRIVEMCRLAAESRYRREGRVLISTVHLDSIGRFI